MIKGINIDPQGRCKHWHSEVDIVANRCAKYRDFYSCYLCHDELTTHEFMPMLIDSEEIAVICGVCEYKMTASVYLNLAYKCPNCQHLFNPGCALHKNTYFC